MASEFQVEYDYFQRLFSFQMLFIVHSRPLFLYFRFFNTVGSEYINKISPMTGFEPRTSGVGSDHSTI